jgi:transposase
VLREFHARLLVGNAEEHLLETLPGRCKGPGLIQARGRRRSDATHVPIAIRVMNRLEVLAGTLPATAAKLGRSLRPPQPEPYEALQEMRSFLASEEGRQLHARRAGIEGTISQGVRSFRLRRARYRGTAKAHLQHVATATGLNFGRVSDRLEAVPRATTWVSRFARRAA